MNVQDSQNTMQDALQRAKGLQDALDDLTATHFTGLSETPVDASTSAFADAQFSTSDLELSTGPFFLDATQHDVILRMNLSRTKMEYHETLIKGNSYYKACDSSYMDYSGLYTAYVYPIRVSQRAGAMGSRQRERAMKLLPYLQEHAYSALEQAGYVPLAYSIENHQYLWWYAPFLQHEGVHMHTDVATRQHIAKLVASNMKDEYALQAYRLVQVNLLDGNEIARPTILDKMDRIENTINNPHVALARHTAYAEALAYMGTPCTSKLCPLNTKE